MKDSKLNKKLNNWVLNVALCEGRHSIPQATDGAIFGAVVNPLATDSLESEAKNKIVELAGYELAGLKLNLYVTGLTVALIAIINAMRGESVAITLYHYDRDSGAYYPQSVK